MYIDPITRQTLIYAAPISCDDNPQNVIDLDPDNNNQYLLTPRPVLWATLKLFEPKWVQSAINPNTFSAQEAGISSNPDLTKFWSTVFSRNTLILQGRFWKKPQLFQIWQVQTNILITFVQTLTESV